MYNQPNFITRGYRRCFSVFILEQQAHTSPPSALAGEAGLDSGNGKVVFGGSGGSKEETTSWYQ